MTEKENFISGFVVMLLGVAFHLLIPFQVSTDPVPGSRGFATVSPSTLPRLAAWGLVIVGLWWAVRSFVRMRRPAAQTAALSVDAQTALEHRRWKWSIAVWIGAVLYAALIPHLGYTEASVLFGLVVALTMLWARPQGLAGHHWLGLAIGVVAFPLLLHTVFHKFFFVLLAPGPVTLLLFGD